MTEDEVIQEVQALVATGEYLDGMLGVPGARLTGGGVFEGNQQVHQRGSSEYLEARAAGLIEKLPPLTPATRKMVEAAERDLGYPFPSLLRRLYLEVANGAFGPGYGLTGRCMLPPRAIRRLELCALPPLAWARSFH